MTHPLFEQHRATLDGALQAIATRGYWSPYTEMPSPKAYGETAAEDGKRAYEAHLGQHFELNQPGQNGWGGNEVAENAFFLRYGEQDADAHALQVWRTEDHADDEAVYRVGFTLGQDRHYDIAWCGLGHGADPDVLTDVEVWLPAGTFLYDVLYYTTADGEEVRREVYPDKNGSMITLDGEILADSIRLASR